MKGIMKNYKPQFEPQPEPVEPEPRIGDLRVWWVSNPPHEGERYPVKDVTEALAKLNELADRDLAMGDAIFANAGGLEMFEGDDWYEFHDEDDRDINQIEADMDNPPRLVGRIPQ